MFLHCQGPDYVIRRRETFFVEKNLSFRAAIPKFKILFFLSIYVYYSFKLATMLLGQIVIKLFGHNCLIEGSVNYFFWPLGAVNRESSGTALLGCQSQVPVGLNVSASISHHQSLYK
jgi:hypothetical protein